MTLLDYLAVYYELSHFFHEIRFVEKKVGRFTFGRKHTFGIFFVEISRYFFGTVRPYYSYVVTDFVLAFS